MTNKEAKEKAREVKQDTSGETIKDPIDLLVNLLKVRSKLGGNVTEDYVLGYFGEDERDFIRENFENAEYAKNIIKRFGEKGYSYQWDDKLKEWEKNEDGSFKKVFLGNREVEKISKMGDNMFKFFMIQPHLIAILHRNKDKNFMVKLLGKGEDEKEQVIGQMDEASFMDRMKGAFKGEDNRDYGD